MALACRCSRRSSHLRRPQTSPASSTSAAAARCTSNAAATGAPTVVLIAGGWEAGWIWTYALAPDDPIQALPYDAFSAGGGKPRRSSRPRYFPSVAKFTRVCLYDRPNTTIGDGRRARSAAASCRRRCRSRMRSAMTSPTFTRSWPPPARQAPFVLAGHSYGGLIVELYARRYPGGCRRRGARRRDVGLSAADLHAGGVRRHARVHEPADRGGPGGAGRSTAGSTRSSPRLPRRNARPCSSPRTSSPRTRRPRAGPN